MMHLIWTIVIGAVAGWLAGKLTTGSSFGLVGNIVVGVIGALVGNFVFAEFGLRATGDLARIVVATLGAIMFLWVLRFIKR